MVGLTKNCACMGECGRVRAGEGGWVRVGRRACTVDVHWVQGRGLQQECVLSKPTVTSSGC